jgi:GntR family transcriptional regulator
VHLVVTSSDELPLYRQIVRQIVEAISGGALKPGQRLQSHRELSEQLVIAPLTVKRAYDELETLGYIETQRGRGTFVRTELPRVDRAEQMEAIAQAARRLAGESCRAGLSLAEVVEFVEGAWREIRGEPTT